MDRERFADAVRRMAGERQRSGIGTLGEKTVHAVLKEYYGGGDESKEISVGGFVADAVCGEGIIEIQTRALYRLERKLAALLPLCRVTVVYPVEEEKYLITVEPDSGEFISRRRSPKRVNIWHGIAELYGIRTHLCDDSLTVRMPLLTVEEYRTPAEGTGRRRRAKKLDRVPASLNGEIVLRNVRDYAALLPKELCGSFTSKELAKACRISADTAGRCIGTLAAAGVIEESGKSGRYKLWKRTAAADM